MTIEEAIQAHLLATPNVAALVGVRVYPVKMPQRPTYPAVVYNRISGPREHSQDGSSGLAHPRFQLDCFAATYAGAKDLASKVRLALDGFRGSMGGVSGVDVNAVFIEDDRDDYDDDIHVYWVSLDAVVWHNE